MAYMELEVALFTALNKDSQALHHEVVPFEPAEAQALSDKAVDDHPRRRGRRAAAADRRRPRLLSLPHVRLVASAAGSASVMTLHAVDRSRPAPSPRSRTGSGTAATSSRCSGSSAMPAPARPRITAPRHRRARPRRRGPRAGGRGGVLYRRLHRQGGAGDDPQGHAGLDHPQPDLPRLGGDAGGDRAGRAGDLPTCAPASAPWARPSALFAETQIRQPRAAPRATSTSRASCSTSSRCCATPTCSCSTRSRWSAHEMAADLLAFGKPILVLGDPGPAAADQGRRRLHRRRSPT